MSAGRQLDLRLQALQPFGETSPAGGGRRVSRFSMQAWLDVPATPVPGEGRGQGFFPSPAGTPRGRLTAGSGRRYSSQSVLEGEWLESLWGSVSHDRTNRPLSSAITHFDEFMEPSSTLLLNERLRQVSSRLELDLLELWRLDEETDDEVYCTYAYGSQDLVDRYPDILLGHYPYNDISAAFSAELCQLALEADSRCYWHVRGDDDRSTDGAELSTDAAKMCSSAEMALLIEGDSAQSSIWMVGFALRHSAYHPQKIEFARSMLECYSSAFSGVDGRRDLFDGLSAQWESRAPFYFPVGMLQIRYHTIPKYSSDDFSDLARLNRGSRADIFTAILKGTATKVVIKMLREDCLEEPLAKQEFVIEQGLLARISHPNVIRLLGMGTTPRPFLVLEWLGGGTLASRLRSQRSFFARRTPLAEVLLSLKELAEALDYMHMRAHPEACILHRDLKPDNIGFDVDGSLKVFDLGLCACIHRSTSVEDTYTMTPNTGSLRYMAPEVASKRPYNQKVDVYSFGIIAWQFASSRTPFEGMTVDTFPTAIENGQRPVIDKSWPPLFKDMLRRCWAEDPKDRPSLEMIVEEISDIYESLI